MNRDNKFKITSIFLLLEIAILITVIDIVSGHISKQLAEQFEYETGRDLCYEDAIDYNAYCHVEKRDDGKYHWYFIEGGEGEEQ